MRTIVLKTDGTFQETEIQTGVKPLEQVIGGPLEGLTFAGHTDFILYLNETGKIQNLPPNTQAILFCLEFVEEIDLIRGDAVICGLDTEGASCDLTDEQVEMFMNILQDLPE